MSTEFIPFFILAGVLIITLVILMRLEMRFKRLMMGTQGKNLEEAIHILGRHVEKLEGTQKEINAHLSEVDKRLNKSIRSVETMRFNPFPDAGSNQSFAIALLNDEGDGVVLSSLYARDRMSIFAKPIAKHTSTHELTEEEEAVLKKAR
jgi:hypothetical protein